MTLQPHSTKCRLALLTLFLLIVTLPTPAQGLLDTLRIDTTLGQWESGFHQAKRQLLSDSLYYFSPSNPRLKKRPWRAALETVLTNVGVWGFDRYVMNEDFARISAHTIRHNIKNGFVWDNDQFSTNLFAHPYHGGLYFNTARANGLSFWASMPYSFCGSLMWELTGEREPPAINDLIATTCGGWALGEVTNRLSSLLIDESKGGMERVGREVLAFICSPMRGLNRMINGDTWHRRTTYYKYHDEARHPIFFTLGAGDRYLGNDNHFFHGEHSPFINLDLIYGNPFDTLRTAPYDYFTCNMTFNLGGNQPIISELNLKGRLWSTNYRTEGGMEVIFGLFQHFDYYDSESVLKGSKTIPYKISEAAAFGPGLIYRFPVSGGMVRVGQEIYANAVLLGGSLSDYYNVIDRNYNMGSGYSLKTATFLNFGSYGSFRFNVSNIRLFTWKGYSDQDLQTKDPLYLNAQGDKGNVNLLVLNPDIRIHLGHHFTIGLDGLYYLRRTHYARHHDVHYETIETRLGLYWQL